jgi:antitoxin component of MazEF toxin-antitoxin module
MYNIMTELNIKDCKVTKVGNSFYFRIPKHFINTEDITKNNSYDLLVKQASKITP